MKRAFNRKGGWHTVVADDFRSGLEVKIAKQLEDAGIPYRYEKDTIRYIIPATKHIYNPDFVLPNGIIVEGKGIFDVDDRKKHLYIKEQYPHLDIRFVFSNPQTKINKGSKTTYAMWCQKHDFKFAAKLIPVEWLKEAAKDTEGLKPKETKKERKREV